MAERIRPSERQDLWQVEQFPILNHISFSPRRNIFISPTLGSLLRNARQLSLVVSQNVFQSQLAKVGHNFQSPQLSFRFCNSNTPQKLSLQPLFKMRENYMQLMKDLESRCRFKVSGGFGSLHVRQTEKGSTK